MLEKSLYLAEPWQQDAAAWPLLAMTHWQLGQQAEARKWLARSEWWVQWTQRAADHPNSVGPDAVPHTEWLQAQVYYREAKTLIDGPESAKQAFELLAKTAHEKRQGAQARAEARRTDAVAKAEAAWNCAVELAGNDPRPWIERGRFYAQQGQREKADADFAQAQKLDPKHPLCRLERAKQNRTVVAAWDFSRGAAGWRAGNGRLTPGNGVLTMESDDADPWFWADVKTPAGRKELTICARFEGVIEAQLYWAFKAAASSEANSARITMTGDAKEWQEYRVEFTPDSDVVSLRFDPPNEGSPSVEVAWMTLTGFSAAVDFQYAIDLDGDNPLPWIHRGRWHTERGEQEKADADFAKAASLTPNELNKFLEAGWWVVGPYPKNLSEFCPPEVDPDPSQPVYTIDPTTGLSDQPVTCARCQPGSRAWFSPERCSRPRWNVRITRWPTFSRWTSARPFCGLPAATGFASGSTATWRSNRTCPWAARWMANTCRSSCERDETASW